MQGYYRWITGFILSLVFDHILDRLSIGLLVEDTLDGGIKFHPLERVDHIDTRGE